MSLYGVEVERVTMTNQRLTRPLFCPICGAKVRVETDGQFPEVHRLPEHQPDGAVNLCAGCVVIVTIDFDHCVRCGCKTGKHPSRLCCSCFSEIREESL